MDTRTERLIGPARSGAHRTERGAQRVHDLTVVAAELFLDRGYDSVSVDELIERVGGSRRNIYGHFGGKEGLFRAAMMHVANEMARPLDLLTIEGGNAVEVLPAFGREMVRTALSPRTLAVHRMLINEGKRFPDISQAMLAASYDKIRDKLSAWIATQQADPSTDFTTTLDAPVLAEHFMSMTSSDVKLRAHVGQLTPPLDDAELDAIVGAAVQTFLYGAAADPAPLRQRDG